MKKNTPVMILAVCVLVFSMILSACSPVVPQNEEVTTDQTSQLDQSTAAPAEPDTSADEKITLVVWDQFTEEDISPVADEIYANFMAENPNIVIKREMYTIDQIAATLRTALASGTGPDVFYGDITPTRELIKANLVQDLSSYADQYGWNDQFYETGLSWTIEDGKLWGLGLETEFVGIFYNQTVFDQEGWRVPQTFSEALEFCRQASAKGYVPMAHSQNPGWQNFFSFTMPIHNYLGIETMEKLLFSNEGSWNSPDMVAAVEKVSKEMKQAGCFAEDLNGMDYDTAIDLFETRESLMFPTGTWIIGRLAAIDETDDIQMMPWFDMETGKPRVYTVGMGSAFYISSGSKNKDAAAKLLDFIYSADSVRLWIEKGKRIPPVPADTEGLNIDPLTKFAIETLELAGSGNSDLQLGWNVDLIVPNEFNEMMIAGFQATYAGTKTDQQQMDDLQAIWEQYHK